MKNTNSSPTIKPSLVKTLFMVAAGATLLGILDHVYLLNEHLTLRYGTPSDKSMCEINALFSCSAVSASSFAEFLGVPMALWGAIANAVLLLLILWVPFTDDDKKPAAKRNLILVSGIIAAASIVMGTISATMIGKLCPFCLVAYALSFITFICIFLAARPHASEPKSPFKPQDLTSVVVLAIIGAIAAFVFNDTMKKSYELANMPTNFAQEKVTEWMQSPELKITPVEPLTLGAPRDQAKFIITEFADYRCPHCKHAAPVLKAFVNGHKDARLEFQAWPLDGECNSAISQANGASCLLARLVYCSGTKGNETGWTAHEFIFEHQENYLSVDQVRAGIPAVAAATNIPAAELTQCADSDKAKEAIRQQAAVGTSLNLQGTPSVYVNNKKLEAGQIFPVLSEAYKQLQTK